MKGHVVVQEDSAGQCKSGLRAGIFEEQMSVATAGSQGRARGEGSPGGQAGGAQQ